MYRSGHVRVWILTAVAVLAAAAVPAQKIASLSFARQLRSKTQNGSTQDSAPTRVSIRWGSRRGVSRYRLQVAGDRQFTDIVFDGVVAGNEYQISDLTPGRYFWRIAPITAKLGEYSATGIVDVPPRIIARPVQPVVPPRSFPAVNRATTTAGPAGNAILAADGWRAAIGDISRPVIAHLRRLTAFDLVGVNNDGVTYALDAATGVALWTARSPTQKGVTARNSSAAIAPLLIKSRVGLDNVIVLVGSSVTAREGETGRVLWSVVLPVPAFSGAALSDNRSAEIFVLDNSRQRLFLLDGRNGRLITQAILTGRAVGAPVPFDYQGSHGMLIAFDDGRIQMIDRTAKILRSGDAGSPATTPPLFVNGARSGLILVGTRSGLTALSADDLRALGRVTIQDDAPRGNLTAGDIDGDGVAEVIMLTDRGRVVAVNAADGKTIWQTTIAPDAGLVALADVNGDRVLDVLIAGGQSFALALSGRDGSVVWKADDEPSSVANHAMPAAPRSVVAVSLGSGILLISSDSSHTSLRAVHFPVRPVSR